MLRWLKSFFQVRKRPLDNVSPRVQRLLVLTRKEADRLHQGYVGTEHLLLGLLELKEGVGYTALMQMKVDVVALKQALDKRVPLGSETEVARSIPYTPRVKKVLNLGAAEADAMNHEYLGTEHVLLGMLRSPGGIAKEVLDNLAVDVVKTREEIAKILEAAKGGPNKALPFR